MAVFPLVSHGTTAELVRVLSYPKLGLTLTRQRILIDEYIPWCEDVVVPAGLPAPTPRDPTDQPFLELAMAGDAEALVTGDNDLLALAPQFPVPIITPRELRDQLAIKC